MKRFNGIVLWYSDKDQNGIIVSDNKEFYFDISVLKVNGDLIKRGLEVNFIVNDKIKDCLCAKEIELGHEYSGVDALNRIYKR